MTKNFETCLAPLVAALRSGQLGLSTYLEQLEAQFAVQNTRIHAFLPEEKRFERLQGEAAALEARYPEPESRPALYGVPIGVKDIFHADGFPTQAGSRLPADLLTEAEAESVKMLKLAGALVLGKTVTTEFAYFGPGPTRNPHNPDHTPGGSSSGSAAAVAASLCPLALGTQTIGSIIRPASFCGIVGFKPSFGRISTGGVIPVSKAFDHIGFFTQDVDGVALTAAVLCQDWHAELQMKASILRLGVPTGLYLQKASAEALEHFQKTQEKLVQAGFEIRQIEAMPDIEEIITWHQDLMAAEAALVHRDWFARHADRYHPKTTALIERGQQVSSEQIRVYRTRRERLRTELEALMAEHNISAWMSPSAVGTAPGGLDSTGDPVMNLPWTHAGLPAINLPSGFAENGLPWGLQLVGGWQQDEKLVAWAGQIAEALAQ
jgi:Asp-tRNA(Asn)/Glu-tRNA(Gln) amidotransferase A subunit family amidase